MPAITLPVVSVSVSVPISVSISIPVSISVLIAPLSRYPFERCVRRNVVGRVDGLHAFFHAIDLVAIIRPSVIQPARKITVKPCLVVRREPPLRLRQSRQADRCQQKKYPQESFHTPPQIRTDGSKHSIAKRQKKESVPEGADFGNAEQHQGQNFTSPESSAAGTNTRPILSSPNTNPVPAAISRSPAPADMRQTYLSPPLASQAHRDAQIIRRQRALRSPHHSPSSVCLRRPQSLDWSSLQTLQSSPSRMDSANADQSIQSLRRFHGPAFVLPATRAERPRRT